MYLIILTITAAFALSLVKCEEIGAELNITTAEGKFLKPLPLK